MTARKIILKLLLFIVPMAAVLVLTEYKLSQYPNTHNVKKANLEKQLGDIEVLVAGSSHGMLGIDPALFSRKGFNLANYSQSLFYDRRLVEKYQPQMPKLRLVIQTISYFSLYTQMADGNDNWRECLYCRVWDMKNDRAAKFDARRFSYILLYTPNVAQQILFKQVNWTKGLTADGHLAADTTGNRQDISDSLGKKTIDARTLTMHMYRYKEIMKDLEGYVADMKQRGIQIVFVTTPAYHTFYQYCDNNVLRKNVDAMNYICAKYNCKFYNYFTDNRFDISCFQDNDHLNAVGAERFSRIVNADIVQPYFQLKN